MASLSQIKNRQKVFALINDPLPILLAWDTVVFVSYDELVQMAVRPAHHHLDDPVEGQQGNLS